MGSIGEISINIGAVKIVVFDDDEIQSIHMTEVIRNEGYQVWGTTRIFDAIRICNEVKPDVGVFDCRNDVIDDNIELPMDGITAFGLIRKNLPFFEPVFVTAFRDIYESRAIANDGIISG